MKKIFSSREGVTAVLFLLALLAGLALWLWGLLAPAELYGAPRTAQVDSLSDAFTNAEEIINDSLDRSHGFIQLYGGIQRLLGRKVLNDADGTYTVYRLSDGTITFVNPTPAEGLTAHADACADLSEALAARDIPLLYLQAPQKIGPNDDAQLPEGVTDYGNANADQFLSLLADRGLSALDFRDTLTADGEHWTDYFFATDHHWTPEAALLCTQALAEHLNEAYGMDLNLSRTADDAFDAQVYEDIFLGSQGKRTGSWYAGMDDLTVLTPRYDTQFTYATSSGLVREGSFGESLLFPERLEGDDPFSANPYTLYSGGDYALAQITNHNDPDGPRILLLRDSYSCALTPFLALQCSRLTTVDLRYFDGDLLACIEEADPDLVLMLYTPGAVANDVFFDF